MDAAGGAAEAVEPRLSALLEGLLQVAPGRPVTLGELLDHLDHRGQPALVVLLCVPFLFPVALPGLSLPFGAAIVVCGVRLGMDRGLWLPQWLQRRELSPALLEKLVGFSAGFYRRLEKVIRPRLHLLQRWPGMKPLLGFMLALGGVLLSLPIPPPFPLTNTIPALATIFMALGLMERDGLCLLVGYFFIVLATLYVTGIAFLGTAGMQYLWGWFTGG